MKTFDKYKNWILSFVFIVAVIAVYKTFDNFYKVTQFFKVVTKSLTPFIVGFIIAYILNIPCTRINGMCKKSKFRIINKGSKTISIISVYCLLALVLYVSIRAVSPAIYENIVDLYNNIPGYINQLMGIITNFQEEHNITLFQFDQESIMLAFNRILSKFDLTEFSKYAKGFVDVTSSVVKYFVGLIVSVYMLIEKEKILESSKRIAQVFLKEKHSKTLIDRVNKINNIFSKYLFCLIMDAVIMMILATVVLNIWNVKYAIILGIMIGLFNLIPYFGAIIAVSITVVITFLTGEPLQSLWVALSLLLLQQIDGNFIGPKIMGEVLDASPLWIIFAVTLGGGLFGIGGMIISVPVLITIKLAITEFVKEKEKEKVRKRSED